MASSKKKKKQPAKKVSPAPTQLPLVPPDTGPLAHVSDREYEKYRHGWICPQCGGSMIERWNRLEGTVFFGCPKYPDCRGTRDTNGWSKQDPDCSNIVNPR